MTDAVRKALIDLMDDVDKHSVHADVWEQAKAALAAPPAERPPAMTISALLHPAYEPGDGSADGAQMVGMQWWVPVMGCDSLQSVVDNARAVLSRWGRPAPAPAGEVAELVAELRRICFDVAPSDSDQLTRAAELLRHQAADVDALRGRLSRAISLLSADLLERQAAPVPVAVSERLPEPSVKVLAHYFNVLGKGRTICAIWVPAKTRSDSYGNDDFTEYDEESDTFYWPEGWYETIENWDDLGYVKVDEGEVIYWQPLPKWPAHALPLPTTEPTP